MFVTELLPSIVARYMSKASQAKEPPLLWNCPSDKESSRMQSSDAKKGRILLAADEARIAGEKAVSQKKRNRIITIG